MTDIIRSSLIIKIVPYSYNPYALLDLWIRVILDKPVFPQFPEMQKLHKDLKFAN
jgi:hypothetical protein